MRMDLSAKFGQFYPHTQHTQSSYKTEFERKEFFFSEKSMGIVSREVVDGMKRAQIVTENQLEIIPQNQKENSRRNQQMKIENENAFTTITFNSIQTKW